MLTKEEKTAIIKEYARFEGDTGSVEVCCTDCYNQQAYRAYEEEQERFPF